MDGQFHHLCVIGISEGAWIQRIPLGRLVFRVSDTCKFSSNWQADHRGQQLGRQEKDPDWHGRAVEFCLVFTHVDSFQHDHQ